MTEENKTIIQLQKRGTFEILEALSFFPRRYNELKSLLESKISSRTLDHRIKELCELDIIDCRVLVEISPNGTEYCLTERGKLIQSVLYSLKRTLELGNFNEFDEIKKRFDDRRSVYNWNKVWDDLKDILESQGEIKTIKKKKINQINSFSDEKIMVETEKGIKPVKVESIREVWENLLSNDILELTDYQNTTYRSSFICALLSYLPYVEIQTKKKTAIMLKK